MKGNNELHLCLTEMTVALQLYVDHLMPHAGAIVTSVKEGEDKFEFVVCLTDKKDEKAT